MIIWGVHIRTISQNKMDQMFIARLNGVVQNSSSESVANVIDAVSLLKDEFHERIIT